MVVVVVVGQSPIPTANEAIENGEEGVDAICEKVSFKRLLFLLRFPISIKIPFGLPSSIFF